MDFFTQTTILLMAKMGFTPIVLIGLLIASLSLILNLKSTNIYIQKFKQHRNMEKFINLIFYTSFVLILMLIIVVLSNYFLNEYIQIIFSVGYLLLFSYMIYSLFTIVFILKEIVKISLKNN